MGMDPSGTIAFGIHVKAWEDDTNPVDRDDMEDWAIEVQTGKTYESLGDKFWDEHKKWCKRSDAIDLVSISGWDCPTWILAARSSTIQSYGWGDVKEFKLPTCTVEWQEALKAFCEKANLKELVYKEPKWFLGASYG